MQTKSLYERLGGYDATAAVTEGVNRSLSTALTEERGMPARRASSRSHR